MGRHNSMRNEEVIDNASSDKIKAKAHHNIRYAKYTFYVIAILFLANALCLIYCIFGKDCIERLSLSKVNQGIHPTSEIPRFDEEDIDRMILEIEDVNVSKINHNVELQSLIDAYTIYILLLSLL